MSTSPAPILLNVFQSTFPSINYIFGNGKPAIFQGGYYRTAIQWEIDELDNEIRMGHPHISRPTDESARVVSSDMIDPMDILRAKIIAEYEAKKVVDASGDRDMGTYVAPALKPASSKDVAEAAAGGSGLSSSGAAALVNLTVKK